MGKVAVVATAGVYFQHLPAGSGKSPRASEGQNGRLGMRLGREAERQIQMKIDAPIDSSTDLGTVSDRININPPAEVCEALLTLGTGIWAMRRSPSPAEPHPTVQNTIR
jgi:hypothetical protein